MQCRVRSGFHSTIEVLFRGKRGDKRVQGINESAGRRSSAGVGVEFGESGGQGRGPERRGSFGGVVRVVELETLGQSGEEYPVM